MTDFSQPIQGGVSGSGLLGSIGNLLGGPLGGGIGSAIGSLFGGKPKTTQSQDQSQSQSQSQANSQNMINIAANPGPADAIGSIATPLAAMFPQLGTARGLSLGGGFMPEPGLNIPHFNNPSGGSVGPSSQAPGGFPMSPVASMLASMGAGNPGGQSAPFSGIQVPVSSEGGQPLEGFTGFNRFEGGPGGGQGAFPSAMLPPGLMEAMQAGGRVPMNSSEGGGLVPPPPPYSPGVQAAGIGAGGGAGMSPGAPTGLPTIPKPAPPPVAPQRSSTPLPAPKLNIQQLDAQKQQELQNAESVAQGFYGPEITRLESEFNEAQQAVQTDRDAIDHAEHLFTTADGYARHLAEKQVMAEKQGTGQHPIANRIGHGLAGFLTSNHPVAAALEATPMFDAEQINARASVYAEKLRNQAEKMHKDALEELKIDSTRMRAVGGQLSQTQSRMLSSLHQMKNEIFKKYGQETNEVKTEAGIEKGIAQVNNAADATAQNQWYREQKLAQSEAGLEIKNFNAETGRMGIPIKQQTADASTKNAETNLKKEGDYKNFVGATVNKENRIAGSADRNAVMGMAAKLINADPGLDYMEAIHRAQQMQSGAGPQAAPQRANAAPPIDASEPQVRARADQLMHEGQHQGKSIAMSRRDAEKVVNTELAKRGMRFSFSEGLVRTAASK